jgi:hypothetical protein
MGPTTSIDLSFAFDNVRHISSGESMSEVTGMTDNNSMNPLANPTYTIPLSNVGHTELLR